MDVRKASFWGMQGLFSLAVLTFVMGFVPPRAVYSSTPEILPWRVLLSYLPAAPGGLTNSDRAEPEPTDGSLLSEATGLTSADAETQEHFQRITRYAIEQNLYQKPMGEIVQAIAWEFLGTPYQAGILDEPGKEKLVVALDKFDCVLFIETVLAIARGVAVRDYNYHTFAERIRVLRYRDGKLKGYCSRLHYFSEWIADNQKRNNVQNITQMLGGVPLTGKRLNFMSQNRPKYSQLANSDVTYQCILAAEANLVGLKIEYIPNDRIKHTYDRVQSGDIVAIASQINGLDVTHTGLAYRGDGGGVGLIHASPMGTVKISPDLQTYAEGVKDSTGIILARPKDPRR